MIKVCILKNKKLSVGFKVLGHANYGEYGSDIVCAGVSILVQTTVGAIDEILKVNYVLEENEKKGLVDFKVSATISDDERKSASLLIESMSLGIKAISDEYPDYVQITSKEVGL